MAVDCCGELREEHVLIREAADAAMALAVLLVQQHPVDEEDMGLLLRFGREFVDRRHHLKEEEVLFPAVAVASPVPISARLEQLRADHAAARSFIRSARTRRSDPEALGEALAGWSRLMRAHTAEEDDELFPLAEDTLDVPAKLAVVSGFREVDASAPVPEPVEYLVDKYSAVPVG